MAAVQDSANRKGFERSKKLSIAEAVIDTIASAQAAFKAMAGIPIVGPALGAVAAGAALLAGYARVQKIRSTSFGGGGGVGGGGGGAVTGGGRGGGGPVQPTVTTPGPTPTAPTPPPTVAAPLGTRVSINLGDEDELISTSAVRRLIGKIDEQLQDGAVLTGLAVT